MGRNQAGSAWILPEEKLYLFSPSHKMVNVFPRKIIYNVDSIFDAFVSTLPA
jgi:hypothetical protein